VCEALAALLRGPACHGPKGDPPWPEESAASAMRVECAHEGAMQLVLDIVSAQAATVEAAVGGAGAVPSPAPVENAPS